MINLRVPSDPRFLVRVAELHGESTRTYESRLTSRHPYSVVDTVESIEPSALAMSSENFSGIFNGMNWTMDPYMNYKHSSPTSSAARYPRSPLENQGWALTKVIALGMASICSPLVHSTEIPR